MHSAAFQTLFTVLRSCSFNKRENQLFSAIHQLGKCIQLEMFYLLGRYSHGLAGWVVNKPLFLCHMAFYASSLGCSLGVRLLLTLADAALHVFVSPLAPQGNTEYKWEYHICDLTGAAVGRFVHFHGDGQHPLEQEHHPGSERQSTLGDVPLGLQSRTVGVAPNSALSLAVRDGREFSRLDLVSLGGF